MTTASCCYLVPCDHAQPSLTPIYTNHAGVPFFLHNNSHYRRHLMACCVPAPQWHQACPFICCPCCHRLPIFRHTPWPWGTPVHHVFATNTNCCIRCSHPSRRSTLVTPSQSRGPLRGDDGPQLYGSSAYDHHVPSADNTPAPPGPWANASLLTPHFYKLELPIFNYVRDPLNWLNQCKQFFCEQPTFASDSKWLTSYHLLASQGLGTTCSSRTKGCPRGSTFENYAPCVL
jgi:hypothetical protein